jgi:clan AA aspartic protease
VRFLAVIDTGFNGYLSVPKQLLTRGQWEAIGREEYEIATGDLVEQEVYFGEVVFDGRRSRVFTVGTESRDILIGTKLLRDKVLVVNFRNKRVTVR